MKIFKFSGYALLNGNATAKFFSHVLIGTIRTRHFHVEEAEVSDKDGLSALANENVDLAVCEKYFKTQPSQIGAAEIHPGDVYRHFKGKFVKVLAVSQDTESPGAFSVVYECLDGDNKGKIWHRPLDMFLSPVDRDKYPDAVQDNRFEKAVFLGTFDASEVEA